MSDESNRYGDGTVFEGVRSKNSSVPTWELVVNETYPGHAKVRGPSFKLDCFLTASDLNENDYKQRMADLRLISAAPDLLEALEYCRQKIAYMTTHGEWYSPGRAIEKADAALSKARGEG